jgi:SPP1 family predicted phage head-tail adaptor
LKAGELRHQITIQQSTESQNDYGEATSSWSEFATVWASVQPISGREFFAAQAVQAQVSTRIKIRYLPDVTPKMRVLFGSRVFRIEAVLNIDERNRELHLMCVEEA